MSGITIRQSLVQDGTYLKKWLLDPETLQYFPMYDEREIDEAIRIWEYFCNAGSSLTALSENGEVCGIAYLNLQGYKKFQHQSLITILVDEKYRNRGIGSLLLDHLFKLAKEKFNNEYVHLEVYGGNPAIGLYQRLGFIEFGREKRFVKEGTNKYREKIYMQLKL